VKKNIIFFFVTIFISVLLAGCDLISVNESSSLSFMDSSVELSSMDLNSEPSVFDPHNPEGWQIDEGEWCRELGIKKDKDLILEHFELMMPYEDAVKYFPSKPLSEVEEDNESYVTKTLTFDSIVLMFLREKNDTDDCLSLYTIDIIGSKYATFRGLRVGDNADKLFELYGVPWYVENNEWHFLDEDGFYEFFRVTVVDGIVQKIHLNGVM